MAASSSSPFSSNQEKLHSFTCSTSRPLLLLKRSKKNSLELLQEKLSTVSVPLGSLYWHQVNTDGLLLLCKLTQNFPIKDIYMLNCIICYELTKLKNAAGDDIKCLFHWLFFSVVFSRNSEPFYFTLLQLFFNGGRKHVCMYETAFSRN